MILLLLAFLLIPSIGLAAISCGNVTTSISATGASSLTIGYTTPVGSDQVLIVSSGLRHTSNTVSTMTHNALAVTEKIERFSGSAAVATLGYRVAPSSGTHDVVITYTSGVLAQGGAVFTCSGASQDGDPFRTAGVSNSATSGTGVTVTATGAVAGDVIIDTMAIDSNTVGPTVGADQSSLWSASDGAELAIGVSTQAGGGDNIMSHTAASSNDWATVAIILKAAASTSRRRASPIMY